ncbi:MAG: hypothetical protein HWE25_03950 [Alphaproteobacteria bacterium]|nr:hypothetical protein [Alphaproteobacteria bacterium]
MSLSYLQSSFLTLEQLAGLSGVSADRLRAMIAHGCLPGPAYKVEGKCRISSFFGDHDEVMDIWYFPRSYIGTALALQQSGKELEVLAEEEKALFFRIYTSVLEEWNAQAFGLGHLFQDDARVGGEAAISFLEGEWQHYLSGTYGLCTRTASAKEIAVKEVMIARIKFLTSDMSKDRAAVDITELVQAVDFLDEVSAPFAPHEVGRSSREKYINQPRAKYLGTL